MSVGTGGTFTRQQTDFVSRQPYSASKFRPDNTHNTRYQPTRTSLAALHSYPNNMFTDDEDEHDTMYNDSAENDDEFSVAYKDTQENPPVPTDVDYPSHCDPTLIAMGDIRSAVV